MATITKGKTFTNGELVTPANLHQMVDSATVANIVNADIAANAAIADTKLATISTANKVSQSAVTNLTTDLAGKAASIHQHAISDTTGLQTALDGKAAASHTHTIANVTGLQTALDGKQASGSYAPATGIAPSAITGTAVITTDSRLSDARTPIDSSVSFSKLVQAVQETLVPTGSVVAFAFNAFAGIPDGWLECNGFAVSRSTYSNLHSKIGVSYGSGDGSTTFNLPDLRGYFIRGSGTNSDGTASGSFATKQSDDVKPHSHPVSWAFGTCVLSVQEIQGGRSTGSATTVTDINVSTGFPSASIAIQTNLGTETRPKNIAMMYCIKT
jgi:microcystin-dependent protein